MNCAREKVVPDNIIYKFNNIFVLKNHVEKKCQEWVFSAIFGSQLKNDSKFSFIFVNDNVTFVHMMNSSQYVKAIRIHFRGVLVAEN